MKFGKDYRFCLKNEFENALNNELEDDLKNELENCLKDGLEGCLMSIIMPIHNDQIELAYIKTINLIKLIIPKIRYDLFCNNKDLVNLFFDSPIILGVLDNLEENDLLAVESLILNQLEKQESLTLRNTENENSEHGKDNSGEERSESEHETGDSDVERSNSGDERSEFEDEERDDSKKKNVSIISSVLTPNHNDFSGEISVSKDENDSSRDENDSSIEKLEKKNKPSLFPWKKIILFTMAAFVTICIGFFFRNNICGFLCPLLKGSQCLPNTLKLDATPNIRNEEKPLLTRF